MSVTRLKHICEIAAGIAPERVRGRGEEVQAMRIVNLRDLAGDTLSPNEQMDEIDIPASPGILRRVLQCGDILLTGRGTRLHVARVGIAQSGALPAANIIALRLKLPMPASLLTAFLQAPLTKRRLEITGASATGALNLTPKIIGELELKLPPPAEAARLADLQEQAERQYLLSMEAANLRRDIALEIALSALTPSH